MTLWLTPDDDANVLLGKDPLALLIGMALDQQMIAYTKRRDFARGLVRTHL